MVERRADERIRTSEWEDIQYKHGNKVGKYATNEMQLLAQRLADANPNIQLRAYDPSEEKVRDKVERGGYDMDDERAQAMLEGVEDSDEDMMDEDDALAVFRQRRKDELLKQQETHPFGTIKHIPGAEYVSEITKASTNCWVVAIMMKLGHRDCDVLLDIMRHAASRNRDVKFVSLVASEASANFPDKHLPCVLLYKDETMMAQFTGLQPWSVNPAAEKSVLELASVERMLQRNGVIFKEEYEDEEDDDDGIVPRSGKTMLR